MKRMEFKTSLGNVWLWGATEAFENSAPVLLAISGAFAPTSAFDLLPAAVRDLAVLRASLPGNHSPLLRKQSVEAYADAFSEVLNQIGRPALVCGSSLGGTVALGLRSPYLRGVVALDPPLSNFAIGPLVYPFRERLAASPENLALREFLWSIFGIDENEVEGRDYLLLLNRGTVPATVVTADGDASRSCESLLGPRERSALADQARVRLVSSCAGHNVAFEDPGTVLRVIRGMTSLVAA